jgi:hypothetical protein
LLIQSSCNFLPFVVERLLSDYCATLICLPEY